MHKVESFALSCNSKISKPFIEFNFFPVLSKKFICISQSSKEDSKSYDFFDDVLYHINPYLKENNIDIIEIGESNNTSAFYSKNFKNLKRNQCNYILSKCLLYIGNLNYYSNVASILNKPVVAPCNIDHLDLAKPYWSKSDKCKIFMSDENVKPSFSAKENPKTINDIDPELLSCEILNKLNIKHDIGNLNTVFVGQNYNDKTIDFVPGQYVPTKVNIEGSTTVRMDKNFDLNFLGQCTVLNDFNLVTDQLIPIPYLNLLKDKIKNISFFIGKSTTPEEITHMESIGAPVILLCKDSKNINKIRLNLIDYEVFHFEKSTKSMIKSSNYSGMKFLSKKNVVCEGKIYNSYLSQSLDKNIDSVKDKPEFWEDLSHYRIYKQNT
jgi:hypothetical protein